MAELIVKKVHRKGNTFHMQIQTEFTDGGDYYNTIITCPEYKIRGIAKFQIKGHFADYEGERHCTVSIMFVKSCTDYDLSYEVQLSKGNSMVFNKSFTIDDAWLIIYETDAITSHLYVTVKIDIASKKLPLAALHEDMELTDFELRGKDGSVRMHRAVLTAVSPVLGRMLRGPWREATEGHVDIPGIFKTTLQHFKNFVYKNTLPEKELGQLLLLASYYMMPDLEMKCIFKLVETVSTENFIELIEFAANNKMTKLLLAVLECLDNGVVTYATLFEKHSFLEIDKKKAAEVSKEEEEE